jgi:prepilin-type N-terminal cleavage/methylation domain-containing protein
MNHRCAHAGGRGFTLIEMMIVVVILGILAAIAVPQFTDAASGARATSMRTQLVSMRGQIEVWRLQNGQSTPGGSAGSIGDVWQSLVSGGQIHVFPSTPSGFVWVWQPVQRTLDLSYDAGVNPAIPDADGDGDGDVDDVQTIENW